MTTDISITVSANMTAGCEHLFASCLLIWKSFAEKFFSRIIAIKQSAVPVVQIVFLANFKIMQDESA